MQGKSACLAEQQLVQTNAAKYKEKRLISFCAFTFELSPQDVEPGSAHRFRFSV